MNRNRLQVLPMLVALVAFQSLTGCKEQAPPPTAPASVPTGSGAAVGAGLRNDIPRHVILVKATDKKAESHHLVRPGTEVLWRYPKAFYVHFTKDNPCKESSVPDYAGYYAPTQITGTAGKPSFYELKCTIADDPIKKHEFGYEIVSKLPPHPRHGVVTYSATPCKGCYIDTDDTE